MSHMQKIDPIDELPVLIRRPPSRPLPLPSGSPSMRMPWAATLWSISASLSGRLSRASH